MKRILLLLSLAGVSLAQVQTIPNTNFPAVRTLLNSNFTYLDTYKITGLSSSVDSEVALFSSTTGKVLKRASLTGIPYMTSGVLGAATSTHVISLFGSGTCSGYLKSDGTCDNPSGSGDVVGPVASIDGEITLFNGTGGKTIKRASQTGLLKAVSGVLSVATSGTDYAPATFGSAILKGNGSGGFSNAASGTDYAPATSGSALLKGNGSGGFSNAASGTDYAPATSGSGVLKGNGSGGFSNATALNLIALFASGSCSGYLKSDATCDTPSGASHTQNTDTGTTQATFQIDSGNSGPKLKNNAGVLEARNAADDDYADFRAKTLIAGDGTVAGEAVMNELSANGTNYISWMVPDAITNTLRLKFPDASPSAGDSMLFGAPSSNISSFTFGKPAALAANGANCSASQIPLGVDASGAVEGCYQPQISTLSDASSVVTPASSNTLTNKTLDAEGTGNAITIPTTVWLPGAGCNNATASSFWDLPTSTPAVPTCVTGTNTQKGVLAFADTSGGFSAQNEYLLPDDFTSAIDAKIIWSTSATSGNAKWSLSTICTAVGATETDDAAFNTASTVTTAAPGTANRLQTSAITGVTATGCAAGEFLHVKIFRDGNDGSDTLAATANLIGVELKIRRAM